MQLVRHITMDMGADIGVAGFKNMIVRAFFTILATGMVITVADLVTHSANGILTNCTIYLLIGTVDSQDPVITVYHDKWFVMALNERCQVY